MGTSRAAVAIACVWLVGAARPTFAQDAKPVNLLVGVGATFPQSEVRQRFGNGHDFQVGIVFNLERYLGLEFDYLYAGFPEQKAVIGGDTPTTVDLRHNMQAGLFDVVVRAGPRRGRYGVYFVGGPALYTRRVSLTTPSTGTLPGICDPYWFVCYPPIEVPTDAVLGAHRTTDIGLNVGGGVNIRPGGGIVIFVEARYHYMHGPEFTLQDGTTQQAKGHYVPITIGLRF
jgi:opacity protein-like surface antigen